jgi:4-amino-4-deoxy-L-arabinose transferase-like glycosyltransferase
MLASQSGVSRGQKLCIFLFLTLLATGLRVGDFLHDHSLNHDEAADAVNLIHRSYAELLEPLDFWVVAPIGFLYVEKAVGQMLGYSELSLRLFPLLAGIALVPAFFLIADDVFGWEAACMGALLLGTERRLIDWSARLKPYGLDALLALLTFYVIYLGIRRGWSTRYLLLAALWGAFAQWFSFPMILVLAGMGAMAVCMAISRRQWRIAISLLAICLLWIVSFALDRSLAMNI